MERSTFNRADKPAVKFFVHHSRKMEQFPDKLFTDPLCQKTSHYFGEDSEAGSTSYYWAPTLSQLCKQQMSARNLRYVATG